MTAHTSKERGDEQNSELRTPNSESRTQPGPVDMHVHVLGNGKSGSGCRINIRWWHHPFIRMMAWQIGLSASSDDPALDSIYAERLRDWVKASSIQKVVVLACDDVYDDQGGCHPGLSGLFVPNDYVLELARRFPEFLPGISIHPARRGAIDELERCAN